MFLFKFRNVINVSNAGVFNSNFIEDNFSKMKKLKMTNITELAPLTGIMKS